MNLYQEILNLGINISALYFLLSIVNYIYKYIDGDDIPNIKDTPSLSFSKELFLSTIVAYINPFNFKNPILVIGTTVVIMSFFTLAPLLIIVLPIVFPLYYFANKLREKNKSKKKMWEELKS
jgi:hypothetical protein